MDYKEINNYVNLYFEDYKKLISPLTVAQEVLKEYDLDVEARLPKPHSLIPDLVTLVGHYSNSVVERYYVECIRILEEYLILLPELKRLCFLGLIDVITDYKTKRAAAANTIKRLKKELALTQKQHERYDLIIRYQQYDEEGVDLENLAALNTINEAIVDIQRQIVNSQFKMVDPRDIVNSIFEDRVYQINSRLINLRNYLAKFRSFSVPLQQFCGGGFHKWVLSRPTKDFANTTKY